MAVTYSTAAITARMNGVVTAIGNGASLLLKAGGTTVSTIALSGPAGTVSGTVLTFTGTLLDPAAAATGTVDSAVIVDSGALTVISGLTVGIPLSGADVIISNGLGSTLISVGQVIALLGAQITGS